MAVDSLGIARGFTTDSTSRPMVARALKNCTRHGTSRMLFRGEKRFCLWSQDPNTEG